MHVLWRHAFVNGVPLTDSDFNRYHAFDPSRQPSFCQDSTRLSVPFLVSVDDRATLVSRYVPLTGRDNTPDTFALTKGTREMGCSWAIDELLPPDRRTRLARRWFALFKATADTRYKYCGSGTNWRNARLSPFSTYVPDFGGDLAVANFRSGPSRRPPCFRKPHQRSVRANSPSNDTNYASP